MEIRRTNSLTSLPNKAKTPRRPNRTSDMNSFDSKCYSWTWTCGYLDSWSCCIERMMKRVVWLIAGLNRRMMKLLFALALIAYIACKYTNLCNLKISHLLNCHHSCDFYQTWQPNCKLVWVVLTVTTYCKVARPPTPCKILVAWFFAQTKSS